MENLNELDFHNQIKFLELLEQYFNIQVKMLKALINDIRSIDKSVELIAFVTKQ